MSEPAGTIQIILLQLVNLLEPLRRELAPGRARATLAELGIVVTAAQEAAIAGPLETTASNTRALLQLGQDLLTAIDAENILETISKSADLINKIGTTISSIDGVKTAVGALGGIPPDTVNKLPERLFNLLLVRALESGRGLNELLELFGVLERARQNEGSTDPDNPPFTISTFDFGLIAEWLKSPADVSRSLYQWGDPGFDGTELLRRLEALLLRLDAPAFFDAAATPPRLDVLLVEVKPKTDIDPKGLSLGSRLSFGPDTITVVTNDLKNELEFGFIVPFGTELIVQPDGKFTLAPPASEGPLSGALELRVTADRTQAALPYLILGEPGGSRLEVRKFVFSAGANFSSSESIGGLTVGGGVEGGKLIVSMEKSDGFLKSVLSDRRLESDFDFGFGVSSNGGLFFTGSAALEIQLPVHLKLGPIEISAVTISVRVQDEYAAAITANIKAALGPIAAVIENVGLQITFTFKDERDGNAGPFDFQLGFKPPNGIGLAVDAGVIRGGGYLFIDAERGEYAGALELTFSEFLSLKAIGLISTKMPDGSSGFSLLIIITAEFGAGFQLGFGFTLLAVGGLLGLNRTMKLQPLLEGVRTGAVNSIMFPQNVIANAPKIISDLRTIFPPQQGVFLIGPMAKIGWGTPTLISISLGIIIQIPGNVVILGVLKIALPAEQVPLIVIQVNFVGVIEFDKKRIYFFAAMFESRIVFLTIEGEMGLLMVFGDEANFVVSVGGFHPRFSPPPLPFPSPKRIAVNLLNTPSARIRIEGYFALTANTAQFGARVEVFFGLDELKVEGHLVFDALFQFSPFYFIFEISASLSVKVFGVGLFSVKCRGSFDGPAPYHVKGHGSISLLFWSIGVDFEETWGERRNTELPPLAVMPLFEAEMNKADNWRALLPASSNLFVSLRKMGAEEAALILHPVGVLQISQRALPLELTLDKVGTQKPSDVKRLSLVVTSAGLTKSGDAFEQFAPAQFQNFSDSDKLTRPAFAPEKSGVNLSAADNSMRSSVMVKRIVRYEQIIIDNNFKRFQQRFRGFCGSLFNFFLGGNAAARCQVSFATRAQLQPFAQKIDVKTETFTVALQSNNQAFAADSISFQSEASARDYLNRKLAEDGSLVDELHVIPDFERAA